MITTVSSSTKGLGGQHLCTRRAVTNMSVFWLCFQLMNPTAALACVACFWLWSRGVWFSSHCPFLSAFVSRLCKNTREPLYSDWVVSYTADPGAQVCKHLQLCIYMKRTINLNPYWHELWKQEKCSSEAPSRGIFYKSRWVWQGIKLPRLMSIFTSKFFGNFW